MAGDSHFDKAQIEAHWLGRISYEEGLEIQDDAVRRRRTGEIGDTVFLLEHEPVYTIGRSRDRSSLGGDDESLPHPVFETNRGGQATYHGPGQLVGYPILDLANYGKDLHLYLRAIEEALIAACRRYEVAAERSEGQTGVWCGGRKVASIGVGVRHWISMHGYAINVCGDLTPFSHITPCGIGGVEMSSVSAEANREISVEDFAETAKETFAIAMATLRGVGI